MTREAILRKSLGPYERTGHEFLFQCPKCRHHKKKLSVNIEKNAWKCWVCEYRGHGLEKLIKTWGGFYNFLDWNKESGIMEAEPEALLTKMTEKLLGALNNDDEKPEYTTSIPLPKEFTPLSRSSKENNFIFANFYLKRRGITMGDVVEWKIGYCPSGDYNNRIVIPSFNLRGECDYFVARTINPSEEYKYKNPKVDKTDIIFNELYIDWGQPIVLVEGVFDAIKAKNAIPLLGSSLSSGCRLHQKIMQYKPLVYVALDNDAWGKEKKIIKEISSMGVDVKKINTSLIEDVGAINKADFLSLMEAAVDATLENMLYIELERIIA